MILSLGITPKRFAPLGSSNDADAQAFITAAGITDATQQSAVNQLVLDLKSANIWTKMKAIYPIVGGTATTHKWNLKDPRDLDAAFRLTFATGWTHSSTGMTPNGTSAYADTFLIPSTVLTSNSNHISYYSRTNIAQASVEIGCQTDSPSGVDTRALYQYLRYTGDGYALSVTNSDANRLNLTNTNSLGFFIGSRTSNVSLKAYKNNSLIGTQTAISHGTQSSISVILGAFKRKEVSLPETTSLYSTKQCAFASIGDGLTDAEASNLYTAVQNYNTTLGRNV
jgi:hypothetical protein